MIIIIADVDEVAALLDMDEARQTEILRPQTSGPCVHYGPYGCEVPRDDGMCPHLDNPDVLCPVKDACYAMSEVARMRDECEAEQDEQDADMAAGEAVYETAAPEWVEPEPDDGALHTYTVPATRKPHPNAWSDEEEEVIRRAQSAAEAGRLYVDAFPESNRTVAAVSSRWYRLRAAGELIAPAPTPDFVGDTPLVTQCDEDPVFIVPHPTYRPGDRVRIVHPLHRGHTGEIVRYFPATDNYLVAIDGMPDMIVLTDAQMEAV
ncbi:MAG: hypothetical protein WC489_08175 [Patescibacteria group bacterium]|jgi:hypothetical protein